MTLTSCCVICNNTLAAPGVEVGPVLNQHPDDPVMAIISCYVKRRPAVGGGDVSLQHGQVKQ